MALLSVVTSTALFKAYRNSLHTCVHQGKGHNRSTDGPVPVEGLTKRNAVRLQAKILNQPVSDFYLELMDISDVEQYNVDPSGR